jgi:murein DD-endopeptidase MepM/ murein hydrolase activator NlpD
MGIGKCRIGFLWALLFVVIATIVPRYWEARYQTVAVAVPTTPTPAPAPPAPVVPDVVEGAIPRNTTLMATLVKVDVPANSAQQMVRLIQPVFDLRKIRSGNSFRLEKDTEGEVKAFEYQIDDDSVLKVEREADTFSTRVEKLEMDARQVVIDVEIRASLFRTLQDLPKGELLAMEFARIFAWDVDFNTGIQPGDRVRIAVEERRREGKFVKYGPIQAAELLNEGNVYQAFRFNDEYYDASGKSLKRAFLISPLKFEPRITSGFSKARLHPISGKVTPHLAVDYGAPTGAPVIAVGSGTVITAGWNSGGYGNFVQIRHPNGLVSGYAHLSAIARGVRAGTSIRQGELIGYVGSTGLSTGPHLHFMTLRGQTALDPRAVLRSSEPGVPISASLRPEFLRQVAALHEALPPKANSTLSPTRGVALKTRILIDGLY